jgi:SAM-dependent methyltransferase
MNNRAGLPVFPGEDAVYEQLAQRLRRDVPQGRPLRILEAGCGREWFVPLTGVDVEITGIDLDAAALDARLNQRKDLQHGIHGDLRTVRLPSAHYDVVYSSYVLEHIPGAEQALRNFADWVAPGGVVIVRVPDRDSVHGLLTRLTPFWLHVVYYRWIEGLKEAGQPGFAPYHTFYDPTISLDGMRAFATRNGLVLEAIWLHGDYARGPAPFRVLIPAFAKALSALTFGRFSARSSNVTFVLRKPGNLAATAVRAA